MLGRRLHERLSDAVFEAESFDCDEMLPIQLQEDEVPCDVPADEPQSNESAGASAETDSETNPQKRELTADEKDLLSRLPPHMSIHTLVKQSDESISLYERLLWDASPSNFPEEELAPDFGKDQLLDVISLVKLIKKDLINFAEIESE